MLKPEDMLFTGKILDDEDLPRLGHKIGVGEDIIHANIEVETGGRWVDSKGRLPMLYEPHVADRAAPNATIRNKLRKAGLAYPKWGEKGYPADSYPRFWRAYAIDPETACKACSWGGPQLLGENHLLMGYRTAEDMVRAFLTDQDKQLEGMIDFIANAKLDDELRVLQAKLDKGQKVTADDCRAYVRGYNGPKYERNDYHTKFAKALNKWVKIPDTPWSPDNQIVDLTDGKFHEELKGIQTTLDEIGYPEIGTLDGKWGNRTRGVIMTFRADNGLPTAAQDRDMLDTAFLSALALKPQRKIAPARANATLETLRKEDDVAVKEVDQTNLAGKITTGVGGLFGVKKVLDEFASSSDTVKQIIDTLNPVQTFISDNFWLILLAGGGFVVWKSGILNRIRLEKHQTGQDVSA
jgi:hypothetical protein